MQEPLNAPSRTITAILFDMDNTLFDFVGAKIAACIEVNRMLGLGKGYDLLFYFLREDGRSFEDWGHIRDFMVDNGVYAKDQYAACCRVYEEVKIRDLAPYPYIKETLCTLKEQGLRLSVVTDAYRENAIPRLEKTGLYRFFDSVITADMTGAHKPDPKVFLYALQHLRCSPGEVLMVGDSLRRDIAPAKRIGMLTAYAGYGDRNFHEERGAEPDVTLADIRDVLRVVEGNGEFRNDA